MPLAIEYAKKRLTSWYQFILSRCCAAYSYSTCAPPNPRHTHAYKRNKLIGRKDKQRKHLERRRLLLTYRLDLSLSDGLVRNSADCVGHSRCVLPAELRRVKERHPVLSLHAVGRDSLRVVAHEHVGEVAAVVDALSRLLTGLEARKRLHDGGEVGLVEVGEGEALAGVEADFVGC